MIALAGSWAARVLRIRRLRDGAPYFLDDPVQHSEAEHKADRHDEDWPKAVDDLERHIDQGTEIEGK